MKKVLVLCCMLWSVLTWAQVNVTFQVDMTGQTVSPNGVHVAGSFQNWNPASTALTNQGNGIYSVTLSIPAGTYQYKFINGNDWPQAESVPAACGAGDGFGGYNRTVNIGGNNPITVGPVCFASCFACNDQPGTVSVTLMVDMSEQTVSPNGVHVAGSFQGWNPSATAMTAIGNGLYSYTFELTENTSINYKFINGNDWPQSEVVPAECGVGDGFGGYNRTLSVQTADVPGSSVCFGSCAACTTLPDPEMVQVTIRVDMSQQTVDPNGVHIVGTFQNWTLPGPVMSPAGNGVYEHIMEVTAGSTIDYKFLNGITFDVAESVPAECGVDDGFGGINRRLELSGLNDTTAATVCFSSCVACVLPETVMVTLHVDMSQQTVGANGVHIAGPFNDWSASATPMTDDNTDGVYTATVEVDANAQVFYKFINGNSWGNEEVLPAECSLSDGQGNFNRVIYTSQNDTIVPEVCFAQCEDCGIIIDEPTNLITFKVNMSQQTVSPQGVHIAGNFNGWNPASDELLDANNDGVYEVTLELDEWANLSFKFINGDTFDGAETVPSACGLPDGVGGNNRLLETGSNDIAFGPVCFSTCDICLPAVEPVFVNLTLQVNMQNETVSTNGVHVAGSFQGWDPASTAMTDANNDGIYEVQVQVEANAQAQFKFINGNAWGENESVPAECGITNDLNRFINVLDNDTVYGPVCFGECLDCEPIIVDPTFVSVTLLVNMQNETVSPNGVHVAGNFQGWDPAATAMTDANNDGIYEYTFEAEVASQVQFKFINGNTWAENEIVPVECDTDNDLNRSIDIADTDVVFGPVCFGACADCEPIIVDPTLVNVTLLVNMQNETVSADGVHVAGNFQGWNPATTAMTDANSDGVYEVTIEVEANSELQFKFVNGNAWGQNESVPAECGVTNDLNRSFEVLANDSIFGPVCFGACVDCEDIVEPTTVDVTFMVNMQNEIVDVNGVHLAGSVQGWNPASTEMTDEDNDGIYTVTLAAPINSEILFKFINGNAWSGEEAVPMECGIGNGFGGYNRSFNVQDVAAQYGPVCYGECLDCLPAADSVQIAFRVDMTNEVVSGDGVFFTSPDVTSPVAMTSLGGGLYEYIGLFEIGSVIEYRFANGAADEAIPFECAVDAGVNGQMREYTVGNFTQVVGPVCFGSCAACPVIEPEMVALTLSVDMTNETVSANGVHVAGTFNDWNPSTTPLTDVNADGVYMVEVMVPINSTAAFKFINGNSWGNDETVTGNCAVAPDGNREVEVANAAASYGPVCFGACTICEDVVEPTLVTVVFQVNMSNEVVSPNGVHIAGSFQGWNPNGTVMNELGGGVYELSYQIEGNQTIQFKFINGSTWDQQEVVPAECGADNGFGGFNRELVIGTENVVVGPVCFSGCVDCDDVVEPTTVDVTFKVDMSTQTVSPNGVHIAGNFQGWNPATSEMTDANSDGIYEYTAAVPVNSSVLFKFINDNAWSGSETVPSDCGQGDGFGGYNRILVVNAADTVYGPVCFSSCSACGSGTPVLITFRVNMANESVSPDGVYIAGAFNGWDPSATQMSEYAPDQYEAVVVMLAGETAGYKFINGMDWTGAETVPAECGTDDGGGNINRSYTAGEVNAVVPIVCFGGCVDCVVTPEVNITFQVNMAEEVVEPAGVFVAGSFNGFNSVSDEMALNGGALYSYTITVPTNTLVTYKFLNGAIWETVPFECGQGDGFGGYNRFIQTGTTDIVVPIVCFEACQDCPDNINETMVPQWTMYPNPTRGSFNMNALELNSDVLVWNAQGQLVHRFRVTSPMMAFDLSDAAAGVYTVQHAGRSSRLVIE